MATGGPSWASSGRGFKINVDRVLAETIVRSLRRRYVLGGERIVDPHQDIANRCRRRRSATSVSNSFLDRRRQ